MSKKEESRSNSNQKLPAGHFNSDGLSRGKPDGATRPMDAYQGERKESEPSPRKPGK